jgi:drug/metabolite transporter (DMT)-like permease
MNGPLLIVIAASLWALDGIVRRSLYSLPPITIVFYEHLIGSIMLVPIVFQTLKKEKITSKLIATTFVVSLFGGLLGTLFITTALSKVNFIAFSVVFLIQKLQPLFAIVSARVLLGEKISKKYFKWAALAIVAAFFVTFKNGIVNFNTGSVTIVAALYALAAAACWGIGTTLSKLLLNQVGSMSGTILRFYGSTLLALVGVFILGSQNTLNAVGIPQITKLIYIAFTTGLLAMMLYYRGLKQTDVKTSTILELALPIMAIIIDMVFYHNFLSLNQYIAAVVLMYSMIRVGKLSTQNS